MNIEEKTIHLNLKNIEKFEIGDIERRVSKNLLQKLKRSIKQVGWLKTPLYVLQKGDKYVVIDGQHRFLALKELLTEGFKKSFEVPLKILKYQDPKDIYILINTAKKGTSVSDILKALDSSGDDKFRMFFDELKGLAEHYGNKKRLPYSKILSLLYMVRTKSYTATIQRENVPRFLSNLQKWEVLRVKQFLEVWNDVFPDANLTCLSNIGLLKSIFWVYWNHFREDGTSHLHKFLEMCAKDRFLRNNRDARGHSAIATIINYLETLYQKTFQKTKK